MQAKEDRAKPAVAVAVRHHPDTKKYWRAPPSTGQATLAAEDAAILAAENKYRADPKREPLPGLVDVFRGRIDSVPSPYSQIFLPAPYSSDISKRAPLVSSLREFALNMRCFTMGFDELVLRGLPFVFAGGAVLGALHVWPEVRGADLGGIRGLDPRKGAAGSCSKMSDEVRDQVEALQPLLNGCDEVSRTILGRTSFMKRIYWNLEKDGEPEVLRLYLSRHEKSGGLEPRPFAGIPSEEWNDLIGDEAPRPSLEKYLLPPLAGLCLEYYSAEPVEVLSHDTPRARALRSFGRSDVDLFIVNASASAAEKAIIELHGRLKKLIGGRPVIAMRTAGAVTFQLPRPYPKLQVVLRLYESVGQVLMGFDLDCCAVAYDGKRVVASPRGLRALQTRQNIVNPTRQSTTYEARLLKYARRGFAVAVPGATAEYLAAAVSDVKKFLTMRDVAVEKFARALQNKGSEHPTGEKKTADQLPEAPPLKGINRLMAMLELIRARNKVNASGGLVNGARVGMDLEVLARTQGFNANISDYETIFTQDLPSELPRQPVCVMDADIKQVLYGKVNPEVSFEHASWQRAFKRQKKGVDGRVELAILPRRKSATHPRYIPRGFKLTAAIPARVTFITSEPWVQGRCDTPSAAATSQALAALEAQISKAREIATQAKVLQQSAPRDYAPQLAVAAGLLRGLSQTLKNAAEVSGTAAADLAQRAGGLEAERLQSLMLAPKAANGKGLFTGSFNPTSHNWYEPIRWK